MICFKDIGDFITLVETVVMFRIAESDHSHAVRRDLWGFLVQNPVQSRSS